MMQRTRPVATMTVVLAVAGVLVGPARAASRPAAVTAASISVPNVLVNDPAMDITDFDTQSETAMALGADGTVVVAYNDSGSLIENFDAFTGWAVSTDGGASFADQGFLPPVPSGDFGDPVMARSNKTGTIFLSVLDFDPVFFLTERINVYRSVDNGGSWLPSVNGAPGYIRGVDIADKPWIAVDNTPGPGFGNVYLTWLDFSEDTSRIGVQFTRSTDDGATFGPSGGIVLSDPVPPGSKKRAKTGVSFIAVGPDHAVYVFWWDSVDRARILMRKSTDQGVTFGPAVTVAKLKATGVGGDLGLDFRTINQMQAVVSPVNGHIYMTYHDRGTRSDRANIYLVESADGGATWTQPAQLNDDTTTNDQWQAALAMTPDGTKLGVFWYDRRLDPANHLIDRFGAIGTVTATGVTFGPNFRFTDVSFPPVFNQDPAVGPTYMGDYDQAAADNNFFYTTWADNRLGNAFHANQPDVRFAKIPVTSVP